ncbi:hypothetical protein [Flagellimonas oceanensis]|uniref:hypothetical protein n=1 Tax=Flagellimonas oceanensis TaxID=2499163 RepID=UPI00197C5483|nr:hypothetical protein [Allomuricauda oceanensis]
MENSVKENLSYRELTDPILNNHIVDRAVNVYHLRRMKVSSANQVHEIDSFWC